MSDDGHGAGVPAVDYLGGVLPAAPYAIERPGPHQPTGPSRAPWNSAPPAPAPSWRPAPPVPRPQGPRTFAADPYAEAFLNGRPHPRAVSPGPVHGAPPPPFHRGWNPAPQGPPSPGPFPARDPSPAWGARPPRSLPPQGPPPRGPLPQGPPPSRGPAPNPVVPLAIPAPSYAAQPQQNPPPRP